MTARRRSSSSSLSSSSERRRLRLVSAESATRCSATGGEVGLPDGDLARRYSLRLLLELEEDDTARQGAWWREERRRSQKNRNRRY